MRNHEALIAFLEARAHEPFVWGRTDCAVSAANAVRAQTGADPLKGLRGRWRSERGAKRVLKAEGGLVRAVSRRLKKVPPAMAARGDVAMLRGPSGELTLGIVEGDTVALFGDGLLVRRPRAEMNRAWSADA